MTDAPRFSVLLPTHARADVLGYAVASVLAQSEASFELLIVGDGVADDTRRVIDGFRDDRIRFFDLPKAAAFGYANRNRALAEARGHYVAFAADDDLLLPDHLARMGAALAASGAAWGYALPAWVTRAGVVLPFGVNLRHADEMRRFMTVGNLLPATCVVHERALLATAGGWPEDVPRAGDWVLWRRMLTATDGRFVRVRAATTLHFAAAWRPAHRDLREVRALTRIARDAAWWPAALRFAVGDEPEQAVVWRALSADPAGVSAALREGIDAVLDRLAWAQVHGDARLLADPLRETARLGAAAVRVLRGVARQVIGGRGRVKGA